MSKRLRLVLVLALTALAALAAGAVALGVKLTPVRGATYTGTTLHAGSVSIKVAATGRSAKISLQSAPAFCDGGSGPEAHSARPATISSKGALLDTLTFTTKGAHPKEIAKVLVKGNFYTFGSATPVFQGQVKSSFVAKGNAACDGEESFQAVKG
jgi:hypothetical protein